MPPFHLAFPVHDLAAARAFYGGLLGCPEGRSSDEWIDFDFFGHQIVAHLVPGAAAARRSNPVDGHDVPVPHFGAVLAMAEWESAGGAARGGGRRLRDPADGPLQGPARRAGDDVLPRSLRQRAGDQGDGEPGEPVREIGRPSSRSRRTCRRDR